MKRRPHSALLPVTKPIAGSLPLPASTHRAALAVITLLAAACGPGRIGSEATGPRLGESQTRNKENREQTTSTGAMEPVERVFQGPQVDSEVTINRSFGSPSSAQARARPTSEGTVVAGLQGRVVSTKELSVRTLHNIELPAAPSSILTQRDPESLWLSDPSSGQALALSLSPPGTAPSTLSSAPCLANTPRLLDEVLAVVNAGPDSCWHFAPQSFSISRLVRSQDTGLPSRIDLRTFDWNPKNWRPIVAGTINARLLGVGAESFVVADSTTLTAVVLEGSPSRSVTRYFTLDGLGIAPGTAPTSALVWRGPDANLLLFAAQNSLFLSKLGEAPTDNTTSRVDWHRFELKSAEASTTISTLAITAWEDRQQPPSQPMVWSVGDSSLAQLEFPTTELLKAVLTEPTPASQSANPP